MHFMSTASLAKLAKLYATFRYQYLEGNPGCNENDVEKAFLEKVEGKPVESPRHTHDCKKCVFLGHYDNEEGKHDLYFCGHQIGGPTVIARWGSYGSEYSSGLGFKSILSLRQAEKLAREKGLL